MPRGQGVPRPLVSRAHLVESHRGLLHMCGLKRVPSKSCLHHTAVVLAGCAGIQGVVGMLAGDVARGSLLEDSGEFSIMQYGDLEDAKRGIIFRLQVRQAPCAGRRARQEDRVLRGYQGNGSRLALV